MPPPAPKRVLGPAPPPAPLSERPPTGPEPDGSEDSDSDDWGPALPSATSSSGGPSRNPAGPAAYPRSFPVEEPNVPKRDDWMIAPPTDNSHRATDPTKLKNRKFAGGPRAGAAEKSAGGVSSIWTETPEQKLQRLTNSVLGRDDSSGAADSTSGTSSRAEPSRKVDEERVKSFTEQTRGRSLVAEYQAAKAAGKISKGSSSGGSRGYGGHGGDKYGQKEGQAQGQEEDDDPSSRPFDREKDMAIGGRLSNVQKRDIMNRAANFGGRFQKGSYL